jgi:hypothetical protein
VIGVDAVDAPGSLRFNPATMRARILVLLAAASLAPMGAAGCKGGGDSASAAGKHPGTPEGARALLSEFLKPGADHAALSKALRPAAADYGAVFVGDLAATAKTKYEPDWDAGRAVIRPHGKQTELLLASATTEELQAKTGQSSEFPGGYAKVASKLKPGLVFYRFKFVEPGKKLGMAYDGLVYVNGHWAIFPKPWRLLDG